MPSNQGLVRESGILHLNMCSAVTENYQRSLHGTFKMCAFHDLYVPCQRNNCKQIMDTGK